MSPGKGGGSADDTFILDQIHLMRYVRRDVRNDGFLISPLGIHGGR